MEATLDNAFQKATQDGTLPGAVLLATNKNGSFNFSKAFGKRSLRSGADRPIRTNDVFAIASVTKLMTSIAGLQCVERGLISLDDDVSHLIPGLAAQPILKGWDDNEKPILKKRQNPLKFGYLLTHSSGVSYEFQDPRLMQYNAWRKYRSQKAPAVEERFDNPLTYEPGTGFLYGAGIDWAGRVIEKLTNETLESYMRKNIWDPLGIKNISFWPYQNLDMRSKLCGMTIRDEESGNAVDFNGGFMNDTSKDCFGGQGCYADLQDFLKILHSLLIDDGKLLKKETAAQMFQPQLTPQSKKAQSRIMRHPELIKTFVGDFPMEVDYDWGIGGILVDGDNDKFRNRGTLIWSGLPNLFWFIDRKAGLCGVFGTYLLPPADEKIAPMIKLFERSMHEMNGSKSKL